MYIPKYYRSEDQSEALAFMQAYPFATIVSVQEGIPVATHLPFLAAEVEGRIQLYAHFAKANEQWRSLVQQQALVIFSEPHAYISPRHYEKNLNVPTWNYIAVHAYGQVNLVVQKAELYQLLEKTIAAFETAYQAQWQQLPEAYKEGMINGIVGFSMEVETLQFKKKLSQNKSAAEQQRIKSDLENSTDTVASALAAYMLTDAGQ